MEESEISDAINVIKGDTFPDITLYIPELYSVVPIVNVFAGSTYNVPENELSLLNRLLEKVEVNTLTIALDKVLDDPLGKVE
jgi:hypothetical protein